MKYFIIIFLLIILMFLGPLIDYYIYEFDIDRLINIRLGYLYYRKYKLLGKIIQLKNKVKFVFTFKKLNKLDKQICKISNEYEKICNQIKKLYKISLKVREK